MKVLVTGASGFLGSMLCEDLVASGHTVHAILRQPEDAWRLADVSSKIARHKADLSQREKVRQILSGEHFDAIAHLGWKGVANFDRNSTDQCANIPWTVDLLADAAENGTSTFLALGSQAEYGPQEGKLAPDSTTSPTTLYGRAKLATAGICAHAADNLGMRFIWMRVFSTFGERDHSHWMIPTLIQKLLRWERPALTLGEQNWDFLYGRDAVRAMRMALEAQNARGIYCLGSGHAAPLAETMQLIRDLIDPKLELGFGEVAYRPDQVFHLEADITKLQHDVDWAPQWRQADALKATIDWYKQILG